ncbi:MAG: hypothetical protein Q8Q73_14345 [Stagnimonas sp.]|nr:hypothetical protein [Stagnimonas sp.]
MFSIPICSKCGSTRVTTQHHARRFCGAVGAIAGFIVGFVSSLHSSNSGTLVGRIASAIVGALLGGASGAAAGVSIGDAIDSNVLDNHRCVACGHTFGDRGPELIRDRPFPQGFVDPDDEFVGPPSPAHSPFHPSH